MNGSSHESKLIRSGLDISQALNSLNASLLLPRQNTWRTSDSSAGACGLSIVMASGDTYNFAVSMVLDPVTKKCVAIQISKDDASAQTPVGFQMKDKSLRLYKKATGGYEGDLLIDEVKYRIDATALYIGMGDAPVIKGDIVRA